MTAKEIQWLIERASGNAAAETSATTLSAMSAPAAPDPDDDRNQNNYYKRGLKDIPDNWIEVESGNDFATRVMDKRYGRGYYPKGSGTAYNKLRKWGTEDLNNHPLVNT